MSRIALALLLICSCLTSHAETAPLRVGITEVPPFVIKHDDGSWSGISIDLWKERGNALSHALSLAACRVITRTASRQPPKPAAARLLL